MFKAAIVCMVASDDDASENGWYGCVHSRVPFASHSRKISVSTSHMVDWSRPQMEPKGLQFAHGVSLLFAFRVKGCKESTNNLFMLQTNPWSYNRVLSVAEIPWQILYTGGTCCWKSSHRIHAFHQIRFGSFWYFDHRQNGLSKKMDGTNPRINWATKKTLLLSIILVGQ